MQCIDRLLELSVVFAVDHDSCTVARQRRTHPGMQAWREEVDAGTLARKALHPRGECVSLPRPLDQRANICEARRGLPKRVVRLKFPSRMWRARHVGWRQKVGRYKPFQHERRKHATLSYERHVHMTFESLVIRDKIRRAAAAAGLRHKDASQASKNI